MKRILAILIILLALQTMVLASGQPPSSIPGCNLFEVCTGEECLNHPYHAPPGTEFCQVSLSAGEGYFEFQQSGQTPCGLTVSGLGRQSVSITRVEYPTAVHQAWLFAGPPTHRVYLPFVWSGWELSVDQPPIVFDAEN